MSEAPLFMVRAEFDQWGLARFAQRSGLSRVEDGSYIMHAELRALFGDMTPSPFIVRDHHHRLTLLGYAGCDHHRLVEETQALADPLAVAALEMGSLCSKLMPAVWRGGAVYRFETRVCPVVRMSGRAAGEKPHELDAFLHRCLQVSSETLVDREATYREWLRRELARNGAAQLRVARIVRFQRQRLARRDRSGAESHLRHCERPDVTLAGVLEVSSSENFAALLRRGLGRHRGFGFGMLLLSH